MQPAEPPVSAAAERLTAAHAALKEAVEGGRVLGIGGIQIPEHAECLAAVNALTLLLIENGTIDEAQFAERKTDQMAALVESVVEQLAEIKGQLASQLLLAQAPKPPHVI